MKNSTQSDQVMSSSKKQTRIMPDFAGALISADRSTHIDPSLDIYARLLGNWKLKMIDYYPDTQTENVQTGIWYFSRTLEGRAIQDVLVCPEFSERSDSLPLIGNRYGTSLRMMNPLTGQWTVDWFNPVTGIHNHLEAREEDDRIVQETTEKNATRMRWIFEDIKETSFHWTGEVSSDNGETWKLSVEFFASRLHV